VHIDASVFTSNRRLEMGMTNGYQTQEDAKKDIVDYIEMFYNSRRARSYLGHLSPNEYERVQQTLPMAA
jgi:transposase InsO family protein